MCIMVFVDLLDEVVVGKEDSIGYFVGDVVDEFNWLNEYV